MVWTRRFARILTLIVLASATANATEKTVRATQCIQDAWFWEFDRQWPEELYPKPSKDIVQISQEYRKLLSSVEKDVLDPLFAKKHELTPEQFENSLKEATTPLLYKADRILMEMDLPYRSDFSSPYPFVEILGHPDTQLGRYITRVKKLYGTQFIYSPFMLYGRNANAVFFAEKNTVMLSSNAIVTPRGGILRVTSSERHEVRHARTDYLKRRGIDTWFQILDNPRRTSEDTQFIESAGMYGHRLSADEILTYLEQEYNKIALPLLKALRIFEGPSSLPLPEQQARRQNAMNHIFEIPEFIRQASFKIRDVLNGSYETADRALRTAESLQSTGEWKKHENRITFGPPIANLEITIRESGPRGPQAVIATFHSDTSAKEVIVTKTETLRLFQRLLALPEGSPAGTAALRTILTQALVPRLIEQRDFASMYLDQWTRIENETKRMQAQLPLTSADHPSPDLLASLRNLRDLWKTVRQSLRYPFPRSASSNLEMNPPNPPLDNTATTSPR